MAAFVRGLFPRIDYLARYPGTIVSQSGNLFDFQPDSPNLPGMSGLPVRFGMPGVTVQLNLANKPRCLLGFDGGNPSAPYLELWEQPGLSTLTMDPLASINLGPAAAAVGRVGDAVAPGGAGGATLTSWLNAVGSATGAGSFPGGFVIAAGSPKVKA